MSSAPPPLSELHGKPLPILDDRLASTDGHGSPLDRAIAGSHAVRAMLWFKWGGYMQKARAR